MTDLDGPHLSEDDRHGAADGSLASERAANAERHLRACPACRDDVDRIRMFMLRVRREGAAPPTQSLDVLWPAIRSRIDQSKLSALAEREAGTTQSTSSSRWGRRFAIAAAVAAVFLGLALLERSRGPVSQSSVVVIPDTATLRSASDSAQVYEREAQALLDKLELERAMLRPEAVAAIDHDLRVVDSAIAELTLAIARDPKNAALRQLLAASYRQKVDILERVGNAG